MTTDQRFHTDATLRIATISAGVIVGIVFVSSGIFTLSSTSNPTAQSMFNAVVFGGPTVWFATNAIRWLQERLPRPANHIVFALVAAFAFGIGARAIYDVAVDPPTQTVDTVYQAVLAISLFALGFVALASAAQRPEGTGPVSVKQILLGESDPAPTALMQAARASAMLGGVAFAAAIFVSPTVIPAAIALTCAVRYACTLNASRTRQTTALAAAAGAVVVVQAGLFVLFPEERQWFAYTLIPSALCFFVALTIGTVALSRAADNFR